MKLPARNLAWVLPLLLTGCIHKNQQAKAPAQAPPIADTEPVSVAPVNPPLTETSIPPKPLATEPLPPVRAPKPPPKPPRPANPTTQQAANLTPNPNPGVSAIGELSSGGPYDVRRQTEDSIAATERSLNGINRTLSDPEQKTAQHIREFLKEARAALASGDEDGAKTLAAKAKVLLSELVR